MHRSFDDFGSRETAPMACEVQHGVTRFVGSLPAGDRAGGGDLRDGFEHGVQQSEIGHGILSGCDRGDEPEGDRPNEQRAWHDAVGLPSVIKP